ncbi:hypothetical protein K788_0001333 (plasmid) [Paraburkholderia caribensis MBA4]|uniref:Uncharacterized protein n=1 Tax=Paraburkholderia caribensis MBA4 TaxID=1323664 RepID=A0A0P0RN44_9BURK|nr:hypothetical protein K788_0001333 [Paraburkholderia caribensis MBA4]
MKRDSCRELESRKKQGRDIHWTPFYNKVCPFSICRRGCQPVSNHHALDFIRNYLRNVEMNHAPVLNDCPGRIPVSLFRRSESGLSQCCGRAASWEGESQRVAHVSFAIRYFRG